MQGGIVRLEPDAPQLQTATMMGAAIFPPTPNRDAVLSQVISALDGTAEPQIGAIVKGWWGKVGQFSVKGSTLLSAGALTLGGDVPRLDLQTSNVSASFHSGGCFQAPSGSVSSGSTNSRFTLDMAAYDADRARIEGLAKGAIAGGIASAPYG